MQTKLSTFNGNGKKIYQKGKSHLLGIKWAFQQNDLQMFVLKLNKCQYFLPTEVVSRST